jgi:hypothetical protein
MTENLLTPSVIKLFGRVLGDLVFNYDPNTVVTGYNNLLQRQLVNGNSRSPLSVTGTTDGTTPLVTNVSPILSLSPGMIVTASSGGSPVFSTPTVITSISTISSSFNTSAPSKVAVAGVSIQAVYNQSPNFARIYGFSFEGAYYGLPRPSIFLVHGPGKPTGSWPYPSTVEGSGVAAREWDFSGPTGFNPFPDPANAPPYPPSSLLDLFYWEYEKGDFSIRLDPEAGPFEQILLQMALRTGADMADRATPRSGSGLDTRSGSGLDTRSGSGLDTRSGSGLRR